MDDLVEQLRRIEQNPSPDLWPEITGRGTRYGQPYPAGPLRHRLAAGLVAAIIAVAAIGFLIMMFRPFGGTDEQLGGAGQVSPLAGVASISLVEPDQGGPSATMSYSSESRTGVPVTIVGPGPSSTGGPAPSPSPGSVYDSLGLTGFSLDLSALEGVEGESIAIPRDAIIDAPGSAMLWLLAPAEGSRGSFMVLESPADLRQLHEGTRARMLVIGRWRDGSLFQFLFDIDVEPPTGVGPAIAEAPSELVAMPDLVGLPLREALRLARDTGLTLDTIQILDDSRLGEPGADDVVAQDPAPGTLVPADRGVGVTVTAIPHSSPSQVDACEPDLAGSWKTTVVPWLSSLLVRVGAPGGVTLTDADIIDTQSALQIDPEVYEGTFDVYVHAGAPDSEHDPRASLRYVGSIDGYELYSSVSRSKSPTQYTAIGTEVWLSVYIYPGNRASSIGPAPVENVDDWIRSMIQAIRADPMPSC